MIFNEEIFEHNSIRMKDYKKEKVYKLIFSNFPLSQKNIIERMGIRPSDLSLIIKELLDDRLIKALPLNSSNKKGRPEILFKPTLHTLYTISLYTESRSLKAALLKLNNKIESEVIYELKKTCDNKEFRTLIEEIIELLRTKIPSKGILAGIGISLVGNVDSKAKRWKESNRWPFIKDFSFSFLEERYETLVEVFRDLDSALFFEMLSNENYRKGSTILLHWGNGIGVSYANEGSIIKSRFGRFGNIGATTIDINIDRLSFQSQYGKNKTLDSFSSINNLKVKVQESIPGFSDDENELSKYLKEMDDNLIPHFKEAMAGILVGLQNLSLIFFPDNILLIGPFSENKTIVDHIIKKFHEDELPHGVNEWTSIRISGYGYKGCLFGSTYNIFRTALKPLLTARY